MKQSPLGISQATPAPVHHCSPKAAPADTAHFSRTPQTDTSCFLFSHEQLFSTPCPITGPSYPPAWRASVPQLLRGPAVGLSPPLPMTPCSPSGLHPHTVPPGPSVHLTKPSPTQVLTGVTSQGPPPHNSLGTPRRNPCPASSLLLQLLMTLLLPMNTPPTQLLQKLLRPPRPCTKARPAAGVSPSAGHGRVARLPEVGTQERSTSEGDSRWASARASPASLLGLPPEEHGLSQGRAASPPGSLSTPRDRPPSPSAARLQSRPASSGAPGAAGIWRLHTAPSGERCYLQAFQDGRAVLQDLGRQGHSRLFQLQLSHRPPWGAFSHYLRLRFLLKGKAAAGSAPSTGPQSSGASTPADTRRAREPSP